MNGKKSPLGRVRPVELGTWGLTGTNALVAGANPIGLGGLPSRNDMGFAMLVALERKMSVTFATLASDPTVPSYMLDGPFGERLISNDGKEWISRKGYHNPIREYDRNGWLRSTDISPDMPATGGGGPGSFATTIVRKIEFLEPAFGPLRFMKLLPCRYFASGGFYEINLNLGPVYLNGATVTVTAFSLTLTAYVADWLDMTRFPIAMYMRERYKSGDVDAKPTSGPGRFVSWFLAIDPKGATAGASATPADNLISITNVLLAVSEGKPLFERKTAELFRRYMQSSRDEQQTFSATGFKAQEQYRFPDALHNASGRMHYLPVVYQPRTNATFRGIIDFGDRGDPRVEINKGDRTGVPTTFEHILTEVASRDDDMVAQILDSIGARSRFSGQQSRHQALPGRAQFVPLAINLT
jgi:hypothetical protein